MRWLKFNGDGQNRGESSSRPVTQSAAIRRRMAAHAAAPCSGGWKIELPLMRALSCVGLNYLKHLRRPGQARPSAHVPDRPEIGYRAQNALIAHDRRRGDPQPHRKDSLRGRAGVVIGKK